MNQAIDIEIKIEVLSYSIVPVPIVNSCAICNLEGSNWCFLASKGGIQGCYSGK